MDLVTVEQINKDLLKASSTGNINFSQRELFVVSLLYYATLSNMWTSSRIKNTPKGSPCALSV